jgi:hypothetical protein
VELLDATLQEVVPGVEAVQAVLWMEAALHGHVVRVPLREAENLSTGSVGKDRSAPLSTRELLPLGHVWLLAVANDPGGHG